MPVAIDCEQQLSMTENDQARGAADCCGDFLLKHDPHDSQSAGGSFVARSLESFGGSTNNPKTCRETEGSERRDLSRAWRPGSIERRTDTAGSEFQERHLSTTLEKPAAEVSFGRASNIAGACGFVTGRSPGAQSITTSLKMLAICIRSGLSHTAL